MPTSSSTPPCPAGAGASLRRGDREQRRGDGTRVVRLRRAVQGSQASKDAALSDDIRLLGRLLGDVVREQAGDEVFDLVEDVRQRAVAERRDGRSQLDALAVALPGARSTISST